MAVFSAIICERTNYVVTLQHHSNDTQERLERTHAAFRKNTASNQEERSRENSNYLNNLNL